jgi:NAD(P)-dependent dehydrogenase (short-subunit alcohol dehydrogenase family)
MTLFDLSGKTAVITGATKGIGRAIASRMAEHGANVVVSSRKRELCDQVAQDINENWAKGGSEAAAIPCHISHKEQLQALVDQTLARFGGIDILVCNAAVNPFFGSLRDIPDSAFDRIMETNIRSNHWLCQMASPHIAARGGGTIIIVSSVGADCALAACLAPMAYPRPPTCRLRGRWRSNTARTISASTASPPA